MSAKLLLASLKTQDVNLSLLIESLELQKQAIVNNDYTSLEEAIGKEQILLRNIEREESTRVKVVKDLAQNLSLELKENTLEDLINKGAKHFEGEIKELTARRKSLKTKIEYIRNTNSQLKDVIEFSRNIIKETMMMIAGPSKRALVNKRV
jgi:hypothetical protein